MLYAFLDISLSSSSMAVIFDLSIPNRQASFFQESPCEWISLANPSNSSSLGVPALTERTEMTGTNETMGLIHS